MKTARCVGLVGGLGVGAAVYYYESNTEFPSVDCAALHLRAIVDGLPAE